MDIGMSVGAVVVAGALGMALLLPGNAHAAEALSGGLLETFKDFLDFVENSGTSGAVIFVLVVTALEMVPLLPTQPLTISAGLIFGAGKGSALIILAAMLAAVGAFLISRGVGRSLAEKVVVKEAGEHGPVQAKIAEVTRAIRQGGPWQQLTAVLLMRLTPVVPFSAANYVLGMTPIGLPAYIVATFLGASVWAGLYCSLGAASRGLLEGGMDIGELLADISVQAGSYSGTAAKVLVPLALVAGVGYFALNRGDSTPPPPPGGAPPAAEGEGAGGNGAAAGSASSASMDADVAQATGDAAPPAAAPGPATAEAASQAASGVGVR
ncbi:hypothetical protein FOA52_002415 [Chlamydomonas sp. UWO 241]|nr:hypothetical protein FOA52_002415 [Chlamydomonas sp. UWO 241]